MKYFEKRYYRIIQSIAKKIIKIKNSSQDKEFKRAIRSAIYLEKSNKDQIRLSINKNRKLLVFNSDWNSKKLFVDEKFEEETLYKAMKILKKSKTRKTLVNIGAHIGSICIPALLKGYFKNCICFEPINKNFNLLTSNIFLNGLGKQTILYNLALSNKKTKLKMKKFTNSGDQRVVKKNHKNAVIVRGDILDNYTKGLNKKNSLVFMDVQGHEPNVFMGSKKTIKKKIPFVFEFSPSLLEKKWIRNFKLLFKHYKYFYDLRYKNKKIKFNNKNLINLFNEMNFKKIEYTDLLII